MATTSGPASATACGSLPTGPSGQPEAVTLPPGRPGPDPPPVGRAVRRLIADLRAGRAFLAGELSQSGWLDFGAFRWRDLAGVQAVRATVGVITPLALGIAGHAEYGSYAALGALPAGFVSFRGVSRTRVLAVLAAVAGMAISTFAGATVAASVPWLLVPLVFAWAYAAGLIASLGPTAVAVALQWPVALLIASALPLGPAQAAVRAGLVLAGGLWQCLLVVAAWTVNRGSTERSALAQSYRSLAEYAATLAHGEHGPPPPGELTGSRVLADPNPLMRTAERSHMLDLAEEAERIRPTLTALGAIEHAGPAGADPGSVLRDAAPVLAGLADALDSPAGQRDEHLATAGRNLAQLSAGPPGPWQWAAAALIRQLRGAWQIAARLRDLDPVPAGRDLAELGIRERSSDARLTLRASLGTSSEAGRHALRLAVVAASAEIIVRAAGLSHGYWAVLTIFIVLRPDYSSTIYRGLQRAAGTVIGAGLGVCTVLLAHIGPGALLGGVALSLLAAYAVFTVNYLLYAVFLTDFVVVLLALLGLPPGPTALARLAGTGIGTALALLAYLLWPTWEGTSAAEKFARLISAQGRYAAALLRAYTRPGGTAVSQLTDLQLAARRARTDAEASADRLAGEPVRGPVSAELARTLASAGHRLAQACLTLGAVVAAHHARLRRPGGQRSADADLRPRIDELAGEVTAVTELIAASLRDLGIVSPKAALAGLQPLRAALPAGSQPGQDTPVPAGLFAAVDGLADAINAAAYAVRE